MRIAVIILQSACLLITGSGITFEVLRGQHIGALLIAAGSLIFAISVKVNKRAIIEENRELRNKTKN